MRRLDSQTDDFAAELDALLAWDISEDNEVESITRGVISAVAATGDVALLEFTKKFEGLEVSQVADLEISQAELNSALDRIDPESRRALEAAAVRIRDYHQHQLQPS